MKKGGRRGKGTFEGKRDSVSALENMALVPLHSSSSIYCGKADFNMDLDIPASK